MNRIKLANPVVVSLPNDEEKKNAILALLKYEKCISCSDGVVRFHDIEDEKPGCLTGIEAARIFSWIAGYKLKEVTEIDVEDIVAKCDDLEILVDICYLLLRVDIKNRQLDALMGMNVPEAVLRCEKRNLQHRVEQLAFNCECDEPFTWKTDEGDEIAASLCCMGYEL